jgi:pantoate--beta-alanine ligase
MVVTKTVTELRARLGSWRKNGDQVVFVPTMGNLHAGHLRLVQVARDHGQRVVVSIYVNPMQFDREDDFSVYPRTHDADLNQLEKQAVDLVFLPSDSEMYPRPLDQMTYVAVPGVANHLEGESRPGHFRGVTTVVARLFNLVGPDSAVFGKKDYQQLLLVRRMVDDLGIPVNIVGVDTVREPDGLAMSSRNGYLTAEEREHAAFLYKALIVCSESIQANPDAIEEAEKNAFRSLETAGFRPDYVSVRRQQDLEIPANGDGELVILAAAWLGKARLIDNIELSLNPRS